MDTNYSMNHAPPIIGLTGGIGSGKSEVSSIFQEHGCVVANADENEIIETPIAQEGFQRLTSE